MGGEPLVAALIGAISGVLYNGTAKRVRGLRAFACGGRRAACGRTHLGLRWSSRGGNEDV
eukprot:6423632-Pyramimonas_sp.AAC.1